MTGHEIVELLIAGLIVGQLIGLHLKADQHRMQLRTVSERANDAANSAHDAKTHARNANAAGDRIEVRLGAAIGRLPKTRGKRGAQEAA